MPNRSRVSAAAFASACCGRGGGAPTLACVELDDVFLSLDERAERGKRARAAVPRAGHGEFSPTSDRADPIDLLEEQAKTRVSELVPIRHGRMLVSPFTYFRGAALPMAADLAGTPVSGLAVQACGDAHLSNFGIFGSAERRLVFDVNDFDETLPARGNGTSSGSPPAWKWRRAATDSPGSSAGRSSPARWPATGRRCVASRR